MINSLFQTIPIVYVLMESKSRNSYDCIIRFIRNNLLPNLAPETIITNYETALRNALICAFPESRAVGCFFHHNQVPIKINKKIKINDIIFLYVSIFCMYVYNLRLYGEK